MGMAGKRRDQAKDCATLAPTSKAPARPGPAVYATASMSSRSSPACSSTCRVRGRIRRIWSREASSGTTPPYSRCTPALLQHRPGKGQNTPYMVARGQLGHYPAVLPVHGDLTMQGVRQQSFFGACQSNAGFVARAFKANDYHGDSVQLLCTHA